MSQPLRVLILEDQVDDCELMLSALRESGFAPEWQRVGSAAAYQEALGLDWHVILADYRLPQYNALAALDLLHARQLDIPFIVVTGAISEEVAVTCLKRGAADYLLKDRLARLGPAVAGALEQSALRRHERAALGALQESTATLQTLQDASPLPIIAVNADGTVKIWNRAAEQTFGWPAAEAIGRPLPIMPDNLPEGTNLVRQTLAAGGSMDGVELAHFRRDGSRVQVSMWGAPLRDAAGGITGAMAILADLTAKKQVEAALRVERERLARELHDSVSQSLYSLTLFAESGRQTAVAGDVAGAVHFLDRIAETAVQALKEMRLLVYELRPTALTEVGLAGALERRLNSVERRAGMDALLVAEEVGPLPPRTEEALYRIAQEALTNALKHAEASFVAVYLRAVPQGVEIEVSDNGHGFDLPGARLSGGLGLAGMAERAAALHGALSIDTAPGRGTTVSARFRLEGGPT